MKDNGLKACEDDTRDAVSMTNFDIWKRSLTPEDIASSHFIVLCCGCCPAYQVSCFKPDTACRGKFLNWAKEKAIVTDSECTVKYNR